MLPKWSLPCPTSFIFSSSPLPINASCVVLHVFPPMEYDVIALGDQEVVLETKTKRRGWEVFSEVMEEDG